MSIAAALLTAEEYELLPDNGQLTELVRGMVIPMNTPTPRHGQICLKLGRLLGNFAEEHDLGHVVNNDSGIITERNPDSVRGADIAFYSYARVLRGPLPHKYLAVPPDVLFEVRSTTDHWPKIMQKVADYLAAGVRTVCVLDEQTEKIHVYEPDEPPHILGAEDELTLPAPLEGFRVAVYRFFA